MEELGLPNASSILNVVFFFMGSFFPAAGNDDALAAVYTDRIIIDKFVKKVKKRGREIRLLANG